MHSTERHHAIDCMDTLWSDIDIPELQGKVIGNGGNDYLAVQFWTHDKNGACDVSTHPGSEHPGTPRNENESTNNCPIQQYVSHVDSHDSHQLTTQEQWVSLKFNSNKGWSSLSSIEWAKEKQWISVRDSMNCLNATTPKSPSHSWEPCPPGWLKRFNYKKRKE